MPFVRGNITKNGDTITYIEEGPSDREDFIYVMLLDDRGEVVSEPFIASEVTTDITGEGPYVINIYKEESTEGGRSDINHMRKNDLSGFSNGCAVLVDYYVKKTSATKQINISPETFGGNFYLEASTLFRTTQGIDVPAEFVIPNCKIQSNFTFTMAATGDPSTFTFTMDAFPDYTRWDRTKKVFASIVFTDDAESIDEFERLGTAHNNTAVATEYDTDQKPYIEDPRRTKE
jgi:hypothetical protein